jgi:hypothetical protein
LERRVTDLDIRAIEHVMTHGSKYRPVRE